MYKYFALLLVVLLAACGSPATPTAPPPPTKTTAPTATPAPIPVTEIKLGPELIQEQDLGLIGGEMHAEIPRTWTLENVPPGVNNFTRVLKNDSGEIAAYVSIFMYDDPATLQAAYTQIEKNANGKTTPLTADFGPQSLAYDDFYKGIVLVDDQALIYVSSRENSLAALEFYTSALLERLNQLRTP